MTEKENKQLPNYDRISDLSRARKRKLNSLLGITKNDIENKT